ncbi:MAG: 50S ribosomal protein L11 methyltransferase [Prevotella sp.]|nr:50S ribosomal protein L11 methyltransferase [Prevotella sp.]
MKYYKVDFTIQPCSQDARDILAAMAGEVGFETFEEAEEGLTGYVQQALFNQEALEQTIEYFPIVDTRILYKVTEAEDKDWNEQWEQEGFDPIIIDDGKLVIHDGRHLPNSQRSTLNAQLSIEIDAHLAFGTGTHETTRMICATLLKEELKGKKLLDAGCGTGILGIAALKLGADSVTAYDIDEWSSDNTRHNAVINQVDDRMTILCGDATLLDAIDEHFDYVVANINRNILLQDMERFLQVMAKDSKLILSGFYTEDIPLLEAKGQELGLTMERQREDNHWACITLHRE